jgi:dipeptidyl aminopeptidase/acylaminoacyl peptidase
MALGTWPGLFHGASTWCGPHDLAAWWSESPNFRASLEACFGGTPAQKPAEYLARSPKGVLSNARDCVVYVNSGQLDTQIAPHHSADAAAQMTGLPGVDCRYVSYPSMGHAIDWPTAVVQIESMKAAVS